MGTKRFDNLPGSQTHGNKLEGRQFFFKLLCKQQQQSIIFFFSSYFAASPRNLRKRGGLKNPHCHRHWERHKDNSFCHRTEQSVMAFLQEFWVRLTLCVSSLLPLPLRLREAHEYLLPATATAARLPGDELPRASSAYPEGAAKQKRCPGPRWTWDSRWPSQAHVVSVSESKWIHSLLASTIVSIIFFLVDLNFFFLSILYIY